MSSSAQSPPFCELLLWIDEEGHPADWNMAADEVLLREIDKPVLRIYRWRSPCISIGFFEPLVGVAEGADAGMPVVRRLTGGGVVSHGQDLTYSVVVPSGQALAGARPAERYQVIHGAVAAAMGDCGIDCELAGSEGSRTPGGLCFQKPVPGDLLVEGQKVAGAGQRRTRDGLLHQGSILGVELPRSFGQCLANRLSPHQQPYIPSGTCLAEIDQLAASRYAQEAWLERR